MFVFERRFGFTGIVLELDTDNTMSLSTTKHPRYCFNPTNMHSANTAMINIMKHVGVHNYLHCATEEVIKCILDSSRNRNIFTAGQKI